MALNQNTGTRFAVRKLIRLPNGTVGVAYVDAETGKLLNSLEGYLILDPASGQISQPSETEKKDATPDESSIQENLDESSNNRFGASDTTALDVRGDNVSKVSLPDIGPVPGSRSQPQAGLSSPRIDTTPASVNTSTPNKSLSVADLTLDDMDLSPEARSLVDRPSMESGKVGLNTSGGRTEPGRGFTNSAPAANVTSTGRTIEPGKGLANLVSPEDRPGNVSYSLGPARPEMPEQTIVDIARESAVAVLGPKAEVSVFSGSQANQSKQTGTNRHTTGTAIDVHFKDENGRIVTDQETLSNIAREASNRGAKGIGFGKGYMGGIGMHLDRVDPVGKQDYTWGKGANAIESELEANIASYGRFAKADGLAPTPTSAPRSMSVAINTADMSPQERASVVERARSLGASVMFDDNNNMQVEITTLDDKATPEQRSVSQSIIDSVASPSVSVEAPKSYKDTLPPDVDVTKMSPAELSATGYGLARTPEEKEQMAFAIAGELGPKTLEGVAKRDPAAMREFGAIVSTMENRAQSARNQDKGLAATVTAGQYSSLNPGMVNQTAANYGLYGGAIKTALDDFYAGKMPDIATPSTHYANFGLVDPAWAGSLQAPPEQIGQHGFGVANLAGTDRPEYAPGSGFANTMSSAVDRVGTDRVNSSPIGDYGVGSSSSRSLTESSPFGGSTSASDRGGSIGGSVGRSDTSTSGSVGSSSGRGSSGISGSVGTGSSSSSTGRSSSGPSVNGVSSGLSGGLGEPGRSTSSSSGVSGSVGGSYGGSRSSSSPSVGGGVSSGVSGGRGEPGRTGSGLSSPSTGLGGWDAWI